MKLIIIIIALGLNYSVMAENVKIPENSNSSDIDFFKLRIESQKSYEEESAKKNKYFYLLKKKKKVATNK